MKPSRRVGLAGVLAGALCAGCSASHPVTPAPALTPSLAVFGRLPKIEDVALSPDGTRVAFVRTLDDDTRSVVVVSLADRHPLGSIKAGDEKLRGIEWLDDDHLLLTTSVTGVIEGTWRDQPRERSMLQCYEVTTGTVSPLLKGIMGQTTANVALGTPMVRRVGDRTILFVPGLLERSLTHLVISLFRIDLANGSEEIARRGTSQSRGWLVDAQGEVVAAQEYRDGSQEWALAVRRDGSFREVGAIHDPFEEADIIGFGPAGETLLTRVPEEGDTFWRAVSLKDGSWRVSVARAHGWAVYDRLSDRVVGRFQRDDDPQYIFFDPTLQARWEDVLQAFPDERVTLASMSDDHGQMIVRVDGTHHGYGYFLVDARKSGVEAFGQVYDGLPQLSEVRSIVYPAADGMQIPAYLTLPRGRPAVGLPLIVLPHGGPARRDVAGFYWWSQALAAEGYAVLQPNFRGSTLGSAFLSAGFGQWGRKMQTDLSDGVRFLVADRIVDPSRVCIVGDGYGGYAALAGVALESGIYRCAASVAGISDLRRFLAWVHERHDHEHADERDWDRFIGVTGRDDPLLDSLSPLKHVASVSVPVLLVHGRDDTVVPFEQSEIMADALHRAGVPVQLVPLDGEDHWLSRSATRLRMLEHLIAFLKEHNPSQ